MSAPVGASRRRNHPPAPTRKAVKAGDHGEITVVPLGQDVVVPAPVGDGSGSSADPSSWRPGQRVKIADGDGGVSEYVITRWLARTRLRTPDSRTRDIRRMDGSRAEAVSAAEAAATSFLDKLGSVAEQRARDEAEAARLAQQGDVTTTVRDLLVQVQGTPAWAALADRSRVEYGYVVKWISGTDLASCLPREVDPA